MKRAILAAVLLAALSGSPAAAADAGQSSMHEMTTGGGAGFSKDDRTELKLPQTMKTMQKAMMRQHLSTLGEIAAALGSNDLAGAAGIARDKLGWSPAEEQRCTTVGAMTGEKDFVTLGKAVHATADDLADAAMFGDREKALMEFSRLIKNCNACHERFRH